MSGSDHLDVAVVGRHARDVLGEVVYQQLLAAIDSVMSGGESFAEVSVSGKDGAPRHYFQHLLPRRGEDGRIQGCFSASVDITHAKVSQEGQLRREHLLRSTLIREINHRIKNSLQGVVGMMRLHAGERMPVKDVIDQCVAQLMAIAVAFGLASRHGEARILLCDMVSEIASNVEQISQRRIQVQLSPAAVRSPVALSERHGANISLVINELVFNAIKHSANADGHRGVRISVDRDENSAVLIVTNEAGQLPEGFSLESGEGLGTGLSLIQVLLPPESCELTISATAKGVCARLKLTPPVLQLT
jgi:two-component sensor histidine kinase